MIQYIVIEITGCNVYWWREEINLAFSLQSRTLIIYQKYIIYAAKMKNFAKHQMITGLRVIHSLPVTFPGHCVTRSVGMTLRNIISSSIPRLVRHPEQHTYYPSTTANCIIWWWVPGRCWWIWSIVKGFSSNQVHISMWTNTYWSQIQFPRAINFVHGNTRTGSRLVHKAYCYNTLLVQYNVIDESIMVLFKSWLQWYVYIEYRNCILLWLFNKNYFNVWSIFVLQWFRCVYVIKGLGIIGIF